MLDLTSCRLIEYSSPTPFDLPFWLKAKTHNYVPSDLLTLNTATRYKCLAAGICRHSTAHVLVGTVLQSCTTAFVLHVAVSYNGVLGTGHV